MAKIEIILKLFPFLAWKPLINLRTLQADLIAGFTGSVIVLPQGVAFAMIAGLPPQYGLYTAIVTPIVAALFGSSRHLISGPTTAISIVVFSAVSQHAEPGSPEFIRLALMLTFMAGVYQLGFGLVRLGALVNFVSPTVITGFTAGAAILIATSQLNHVLGLALTRGESFLSTWLALLRKIDGLNPYVFAVAMVTLVSAIVLRKLIKRGPVLLLAMIIGSLANWAIQGEQHGVTLVGKLTAYLPEFTTHDFSISSLRLMAPQALAVSLLGLIEAVSISTSVATRSRQQIDVNQEFVGQGLSNIVGSFFSSYAGSGSFTRTGVNFEAGARTQLSAIFSALFLLIILIFASSLTAYLPVAAMGGIILLVAYNLVEFHQIRMILQVSRTETLIFGITFLATLFLNLEFAIYAGVILSLFFFLSRSSKPSIVSLAPDSSQDKRRLYNAEWRPLTECPQLKIIQINGSLFFGAVHHVVNVLKRFQEEGFRYKHFLIVADGINLIDVAGAEMLSQQVEQLRKHGGNLCFVGLKEDARAILDNKNFKHVITRECHFDSITTAIARIVPHLDKQKCQLCFRDVFRECSLMKE
jgi:SulP family sulfate permease